MSFAKLDPSLHRPSAARVSKRLDEDPQVVTALKSLQKAVAAQQAAAGALIYKMCASAQGRPGQAPLVCSECGLVPDAERLSKSAFCPSCLVGFTEKKAPTHIDDHVRDEDELDDHMNDGERKWRGVATKATGVPFGRAKSRVRAVKSSHGGRLDGGRLT